MMRRAGRPAWWVVGLSLFLALVVGAVVWLALRPTTYHAPLDRSGGPRASVPQASALLRGLVSAVDRDDPAAASRLGASTGAEGDLAGVVRNGAAVRVRGFALRYVDQAGGVAPDGAWTADVASAWQFGGFDPRPVQMEVRVRFAVHGGRLGIAGIGGGDRRTPIWLTGPVQVRRTPSTLVLVQGSSAQADRIAGLARVAVPQVRRVLPTWGGHLVVEEPGSQAALEAALQAAAGAYTGIAAVTTSVDGSRNRDAAVHVFVNPPVLDPLGPRGAQVVLTHEATHVATRAATSPAPIWLVEGFADYVALRAQHIPLATSAARIAALVRQQGAPPHLPDVTQFAADAPHLEARYESAWLACRLLAAVGGQDHLVAFYEAVDAGQPVETALHRQFGFGLSGLTERWRTALSHLPA
jgi:hypothetical protein